MMCEKCGAVMIVCREGSAQGLYCTRCDWSIVTTKISEIWLDATDYEIFVRGADYRNKRHVKVVSEVSGANFLVARKLLQDTRSIVFKGKAVKVAAVRKILGAAGMACVIRPGFPW